MQKNAENKLSAHKMERIQVSFPIIFFFRAGLCLDKMRSFWSWPLSFKPLHTNKQTHKHKVRKEKKRKTKNINLKPTKENQLLFGHDQVFGWFGTLVETIYKLYTPFKCVIRPRELPILCKTLTPDAIFLYNGVHRWCFEHYHLVESFQWNCVKEWARNREGSGWVKRIKALN